MLINDFPYTMMNSFIIGNDQWVLQAHLKATMADLQTKAYLVAGFQEQFHQFQILFAIK